MCITNLPNAIGRLGMKTAGKKYICTFALLTVLTGCATVGPDYSQPEMQISKAWQESQVQPEIFKATQSSQLSTWWQQLGDPILSELITSALKASPDIKSAEAKLRESRARLGVSEADMLPSLSMAGSAIRSKSVGGASTHQKQFSAGFDVSWEIDIFGGTRRAVEAAEASLQASKAELSDVQVTLVAEVARNYAEYRNAQSRIAIANKNLASQTNTLQITEWEAQAGLSSSLEVEQARTNREQTHAQIPQLQTNLSEAAHRLSVLLGEQPGALKKVLSGTVSVLNVPKTIEVGIPANILRQRPDVRVAERLLAAETARIGEAEAALYPSLNLSGSIVWTSQTLAKLIENGVKSDSLLASLAAPIFNAGKLRKQVKIQTAIQQQALVNYHKTLLTTLEEVENGLVSLANSRQRMAALAVAADSARNAALLAHNQYDAGLVDFQTVLTTERSQLSVEDSLANAKNDEIIALIALYKALGGGWAADASAQTNNIKQDG